METATVHKITFCLALGLLMLAGIAFAQDTPDKPSSNYFKTSDGVKIHYLVQGKGTPVILIHGYTGSAGKAGRSCAYLSPPGPSSQIPYHGDDFELRHSGDQ